MERTKTISTTGELVMELGAVTETALFFSSLRNNVHTIITFPIFDAFSHLKFLVTSSISV